ncbi:hypothetical protein L6164_029413 [Bauhinia variegata]|uniref:Uncharacterized protein n=1 Tax=Bauhinia variegata TaxID=167791 RepID=A0ACB9L9B0_BAUVA|nr:hypothetical protein L6164_029413 [Bauhinia variegata]
MTSSVEMANEENRSVEKNCGGDGAGVSGKMEEAVTLKKGPWTAAEDAVLIEYVKKNGEGNWNAVQKNTGLARCGKSCRLRWANHLRPNLKKGAFSPEEEKLILQLHAKYGNKWAKMATLLPGRTDNEIKNFWNTRVKRRQRQGLPLYSDELEYPSTPTTPATPSTPTTPTAPTTTKFDFLKQNHYHHHSLPPTPPPHSPLSSPIEHKPTFNAFPSFDSSSLPLSFTFQRPPPVLCNPLRFKRYRTSPRYPLQVSPTPTSSATLENQNHTSNAAQLIDVDAFKFPLQLNPATSQFFQTPLLDSDQRVSSSPSVFPTRLELPSNQFSQPLEPEIKFDMLMNDPASHTSSDFLGDILMEAEAFASGHTSNKRSYSNVNEENYLLDDLPLSSLNWSSTTSGLRPREETQDLSKCTSEDLSLFDEMPSTLQIPDWQWHNESAAAAAGMSNVQTSNSIMPHDNLGLDMKPMASPFPITTTTNHNESTSYYTWDNLPGLC